MKEVEAVLKEPLKTLGFNALDIRSKNGVLGYPNYCSFKCLVKLINQSKEYDND